MNYCIVKTSTKGYTIFSNKVFYENDIIQKYTTKEKTDYHELLPGIWETHFCRYCNHSALPNTKLKDINGELYLIAKELIEIGDEILVNYKDVESHLNTQPNVFYKNHFLETKLNNFGIA